MSNGAVVLYQARLRFIEKEIFLSCRTLADAKRLDLALKLLQQLVASVGGLERQLSMELESLRLEMIMGTVEVCFGQRSNLYDFVQTGQLKPVLAYHLDSCPHCQKFIEKVFKDRVKAFDDMVQNLKSLEFKPTANS